MDINKRTILWIVFTVSLVILWNNWLVSNGKPSMFAPAPAAVTAPASASAAATALPAAANGIPAAGAAATGAAAAAPAPVASELITITTDVFKVDIDTAGGIVKRLELLKFKAGGNPGWLNGCWGLFAACQSNIDPNKNEVLFKESGDHVYTARTGLIATGVAEALPNHNTVFTAKPGARVLEKGNQVQLVLEAEQGGVKLTKTFTFKRGDYVIDVRHDVANNSGAAITPSLYLQLLHDGHKAANDSMFMSSFIGPMIYTDEKKYQKFDFESIAKGKADHPARSNEGWIAMGQQFFVSAFVPPEHAARTILTEKVGNNLFAVGTVMPLGTIAPGAIVSNSSKLYSGPQESQRLEQVTTGLELVKDYGWLTMIAKPMFWVMEKLHNVIGNWGWTIIVFTIMIKLAFFPLSAASFRSMAKIKQVTPKMQAIRERYKDDTAKMNQATMELYKAEKINPLGGCLPVLVQFPVFIALYYTLQASVEMRGAPWLGWIVDLSQHDPWLILPGLYAISMFITQKMTPAPADPMQAKMMLMMPLFFSVMFFVFPSGLVLYWIVNNVFTIGQQYYINKQYGAANPA